MADTTTTAVSPLRRRMIDDMMLRCGVTRSLPFLAAQFC
jgi:hypothetical protein